ncbi:MAG: hypothetical protein KDB07_07645, partial [Planctomycetes bacterium]|nr:hypothetical protein [Planctomycetota bacterium]
CGHELCCKTFLLDFVPVTMKMAKNQGLGLDNNKISGMCGRLKCCLKYEDELYDQLRKTMPISGQPAIRKSDGAEGWVAGLNVLMQTVVLNVQGAREEIPVEEIEFDPKMNERQVRRWQKEMREGLRVAAEERARERQDRERAKADRQAARMAPSPASEGNDSDESANESNEGGEGEENKQRESRPRRGPRRSNRPSSERREGGGDESVSTQGDGGQRKKRRRRSRGGRGRKKPGGGGGNGPAPSGGGGE